MSTFVIKYEEYQWAAKSYKEAATRVHEGIEFFKKTVNHLYTTKAMEGQTANNMLLFLGEMTSLLKATFKEQLTLASSLCDEYIQKINQADIHGRFSASGKGPQPAYYFEASRQPSVFNDKITIGKEVIRSCASQLKNGPISDIKNYTQAVENIIFNESKGATSEQNTEIAKNAVRSIKALTDIFSAYVECMESIVTEMDAADAHIRQQIFDSKPIPRR